MVRGVPRPHAHPMHSSTPPHTDTPRRLYRSRDDRKIAGVCGGLARYLGVDPVLIRIGAVVLAAMGPGLIAYAAAWILVPEHEQAAEPSSSTPTPAPAEPVAA
jgi:phage shock protein C